MEKSSKLQKEKSEKCHCPQLMLNTILLWTTQYDIWLQTQACHVFILHHHLAWSHDVPVKNHLRKQCKLVMSSGSQEM